jgi:predicted ATPase
MEREIAGGAAGPPPTPPTLAPRATTKLIGRDEPVASLHRLLAAERLVTIVGPGGVGKTSVALEVARRSGPATVLLLAPVTDPAAIPYALAAALQLDVAQGDVLAACVAVLGDEPSLLVVDNCEHLLEAVGRTVETVLNSCPRVSVLATSREPLGLAAEYTSRLAPLTLPGRDSDLRRVPAVQVFLERAARVRPGPPLTDGDLRTVAEIVHRLDGMPLAIELAAGRLSTLSLGDLRDRLDRSLDLLGSRTTGDSRHRTLRTTIGWSYDLLTADEQRLFRQLSIFPNGLDLAMAERYASELDRRLDPGSVLARLVDASMVEADFSSGTRYRMLETLRTYGLDRLAAAGESDTAAERLIRWAIELSAWVDTESTTPNEPEADAVLRRELPNLRAAWRLARGRGALDEAASMVAELMTAITYRDLLEIRSWAEELAADPDLLDHPRQASVLGAAAEAAYHRGDYSAAERLARAGLERATDDDATWMCLLPLSVAELARGAYAEVIQHSLTAAELAGRSRESFGIAALAAAYSGDLDRARALNARGIAVANSPTMHAWGAYVAGEIESAAANHELAEPHYVRAIALARSSGASFLVGVATVGLLAMQARAGRTDDALRGYWEVIDYFARTLNWTHLWVALRNLADLLRRLGDEEQAALIDAAADSAPDAPALGPATGSPLPVEPANAGELSRTRVLEAARNAIAAQLAHRS